jgi:hypothetical protein
VRLSPIIPNEVNDFSEIVRDSSAIGDHLDVHASNFDLNKPLHQANKHEKF